jgi:hypothetical protein
MATFFIAKSEEMEIKANNGEDCTFDLTEATILTES